VDEGDLVIHDALEFAILAGVIGAGRPTQDVDGVVVAPHEAVEAEMRDLRPRVAGDGSGEGDLQAAPHLVILRPGLDLLAFETRVGIEERRGEIGPQGLAGEIRDVKWRCSGFRKVKLLEAGTA
jgi:hypothetical protein